MSSSKENQQTISTWAEETFGQVAKQRTLVTRALTEMQELLDAVDAGDRSEIGKETADVVILLYRLLEMNGLDMDSEISKKMAINRARKWQSAGDGTGKHIA